jgi:predicted nucleotidyltransferase component of viral defense system
VISQAALNERAQAWGLREDVVEKDYVLGWLLWGIGADPVLGRQWAFKGGTCLKKCFLETYRFSEDLDFTVLPGGPVLPKELEAVVAPILERIAEASGIDFSGRAPVFRPRPGRRAAEGRIYYVGPRGAPGVASVKLDLDGEERMARPAEPRPIAHDYDEGLPEPATVLCYSFPEVFAEKLRAMGQRGRPRDLYDIVYLYRRDELRPEPGALRLLVQEKAASKGCPVPTIALIEAGAADGQLEQEWANMLTHQLPALPPFQDFWRELSELFRWLDGAPTRSLAAMPIRQAVSDWRPSPTLQLWPSGAIEQVRFAALNHLIVEFDYTDEAGSRTHRRVEPYSLRQTTAGNLILGAFDLAKQDGRTFRLDRMRHLALTGISFVPRFAVEVAGRIGLAQAAPPRVGRMPARRASAGGGVRYVIQCPVCLRTFNRQTSGTVLHGHKNRLGLACPGRHGIFLGTR